MTKNEIIKDFKIFRDHCIAWRRDFNTYTALYASSQQNIDILNNIAPVFFSDIQEIMTRDLYARCSILMDPATSIIKKKIYENISINYINDQLDKLGLLDMQIKRTAKSLLKYGEIVKKPRNKLIGHLDRKSVRSGRTLGKHKSEKLDKFLENIQKYCDLVGIKIGIGPLDFLCSSCQGDALDMLCRLRKCLNS